MNEKLINELKSLGPWHQMVQITSYLNTDITKEEGSVMANHSSSADFIKSIYGDSLSAKTMLDCGCNAGAHLFESTARGLKKGLGFDARELWINQANFLKRNIDLYDTSGLDFKLLNFYDIPTSNIGKFDICMFSGLFYHLENPFLALQILGNTVDELLIVNTAFEAEHDQTTQKDCLYFKPEGTDAPLSGIHGVAWSPSGERILYKMLKRVGFVEFKLMFKRMETYKKVNALGRTSPGGRLAVAASKIPGLLTNAVVSKDIE